MVLLYADDTFIFGLNAEDFQNNLNIFYEYSQQWKLIISYTKTKVMTFGAYNTDDFQFKLGDNVIEICKEFRYIRVQFSS